MHLIIDGYSDNRKLLQDKDRLCKWLEDCPARIGMNRISPPYVLRYVGANPADWGISGFVFIAESHISVHTFVERSYVNIDIFSCRDFDTEKAIEDLRNNFQLFKLRTSLVDREWPPEVAATSPISFAHHGE
jgi:S-adenosylmethionine decarboxylase